MDEIKRDIYLNRLIERKENGSIKVITGIRRCGKSFLLFTLYRNYLIDSCIDASRIIAVALDADENEELRDHKKLSAYLKEQVKDDGVYYRSEEHTSELQSPDHLVCRLLLAKKRRGRDRVMTVMNMMEESCCCCLLRCK